MTTPTWLNLSNSWDRQRTVAAEDKRREDLHQLQLEEVAAREKQAAIIEAERQSAIEAASRPFADANAAGGLKAEMGMTVPQSPAAMRRGDAPFQYGTVDVATPEAPGSQPKFAQDRQANIISSLKMAGNDPRMIAQARQDDLTNRLSADAARINSFAQSADPEELKSLLSKVSLDKRNKYETEFDPATGLTRIKHGETSVQLSRGDLGKYLAAKYRLQNGDNTAAADIEAIDTKLAKVEVESLKSAETIAKSDNQATRTNDLDEYRDRSLDLRASRLARSGINQPKPLTTVQQRGNFEIDAAREQVAGLTPDEIRRRTAKTTDTGRENENYDPTLARASTLASRRKLGDDQEFDSRQRGPAQPAAPTIDRQELAKRFRGDTKMNSYRLGSDTPNGVEVLDKAGKVVGHYK